MQPDAYYNRMAIQPSFHVRYDCLDMDRTVWLLFGIVAILVTLAILALFAGWFPF